MFYIVHRIVAMHVSAVSYSFPVASYCVTLPSTQVNQIMNEVLNDICHDPYAAKNLKYIS